MKARSRSRQERARKNHCVRAALSGSAAETWRACSRTAATRKHARFITLQMQPKGSQEPAPAAATGPIVAAPFVPHDPETLVALEYKWINARDRQTFEEIWADDYEDASENGRFTKQQIFARPAPPRPPGDAQPPWMERLEGVHVRFYDTIGIVTGRVDRRDNSGKIILQRSEERRV